MYVCMYVCTSLLATKVFIGKLLGMGWVYIGEDEHNDERRSRANKSVYCAFDHVINVM